MTSVTASAPGSIMVLGEHAVVKGAPSLVAAIDQRAEVRIEPLPGRQVEIRSQIAPPFDGELGALPDDSPYGYIIAILNTFDPAHGVRITTSSQIDPTMGLGSSAAITIAAIGALSQVLELDVDAHETALSVVRGMQGRGSGADLAASLHGGLISYQLESPSGTASRVEPMPAPPPLGLRYVGYKTKTGVVLEKVAEAEKQEPERYARIYNHMRQCAAAGVVAAKAGDWAALAVELTTYHELMTDLGVSDPNLDALVAGALEQGAPAAKISGSGLGDCVLSFGSVPSGFTAAALASEGLIVHE